MSVLRIFRPFRLGVWGALAVLFLSGLAFGTAAASTAGIHGPIATPGATCPGASVASSYAGTVSIVGGPLTAASAVGVPLRYNYSVEVENSNRSSGALISRSCELLQDTTISGPNGSFSLALTLASTHCYGEVCTHQLGPYGPVGFGLSGAAPGGYEAISRANRTSLSVSIVAELGELELEPNASSRTLSTNAPGSFVAKPLTSLGSPSPLSPTFRWNLTGTGWSFDGTVPGANATVAALPGAGVAELSVDASVEVGSNRFSTNVTGVDLEAIPTTFTGGDANRTNLDVGGAVSFTVTGSGAPGYTYSAIVTPGLGLAAVDWPCSVSPSTGGGGTIACSGAVAYPTVGMAYPSAELTNTFSTAEGLLPSVTVAPLPAIALAPESPVGYAGDPVPIRVSALPGSGTPPYMQACLDDGVGTTLCSAFPGPNWTFSPVYPAPGTFSARAWLVDSDGTNRSVTFPVTVVDPLIVTSFELPASIRADAPVVLSAELSGGDLPLQYWWNVSGATGSVASGRLSVDGVLNATWVPTEPGKALVYLTVVDALGTQAETSSLASVGPALASSLAEVTVPGAGPAVAGTAIDVAWQAQDLQGAAVPGFATTGVVELSGPGDATVDRVYVNASGVGPLAEVAAGTFAIPTSAWTLGRLSLTVASTQSGSFQLGLSGADLLTQTSSLNVQFAADLDHLHFYDPTIALAGARVNQTFWLVADEYGNPAPGAAVDISYSSSETSSEMIAPLQPVGDGATGVWVNFTAPDAIGGWREVTDAAGTTLLPLTAVPPAPTARASLTAPELTLATAAPIGAIGLGLTAWATRRRREPLANDDRPTQEELRRMVEGRDRVISLVREVRAVDLVGLENAWGSTAAPADLADWVASLVADGTLGARTGPDGVARFYLIASAEGPPIVLLDPDALDRATAARRELLEERPPGQSDSPDQDGSRPTRS